nr:hypothetical protein [uncultured Actinoplanes sp.]
MSKVSSTVRWTAAAAATGLVSSAILFGITTPAMANTNFNGTCESSEACIWEGDVYEHAGWDYEGTDTNLSNNYYPRTGDKVDNNSGGLLNLGTSCTAVFGNNYGSPSNSTVVIRIARGGSRSLIGTSYRNIISSMSWSC